MTVITRRCVTVFGVLSLAVCAVAPAASAQASGGGWGAEGRIGSGTQVYLTRWFSADWSALIGGGYTNSSSTFSNGLTSNSNNSLNLNLVIRRSWGTGNVRPFLGAGPTYLYQKAESKSTAPGATSSESTTSGYGGRGEFGALIPVNQSVSLGLVSAVTYGRNTTENTGSAVTTKSKTTQVSVGNLQFLVGVKF